MRLLVIADVLDPPGAPRGGLERYLDITTPALIARGHELRFIVRELRDPATPYDVRTLAWADEHDAPDARSGDAVRAEIATFRPDATVVHTVMDRAVVDAALTAPQMLAWIHDHRPFCPNGDRRYPIGGRRCTVAMGGACLLHSLIHGCAYGPRPATARLIASREALRDAYARAGNVAVASHAIGDEARTNGIAAERITQLGLPLAADAFARVIAPPPERPVVVFAGRIVAEKGLTSAVQAIATITAEVRPLLRVLGEGPALRGALALARTLGVDVEAEGLVGAPRVREALDTATMLVLPTLYGEPFGYVGIEAFARGRPVAAYGGAGVDTWLRDGAGIAVPPGDERALGTAIATLAEPHAWARASAAARHEAERYRLDAHIDAFEALLAEGRNA